MSINITIKNTFVNVDTQPAAPLRRSTSVPRMFKPGGFIDDVDVSPRSDESTSALDNDVCEDYHSVISGSDTQDLAQKCNTDRVDCNAGATDSTPSGAGFNDVASDFTPSVDACSDGSNDFSPIVDGFDEDLSFDSEPPKGNFVSGDPVGKSKATAAPTPTEESTPDPKPWGPPANQQATTVLTPTVESTPAPKTWGPPANQQACNAKPSNARTCRATDETFMDSYIDGEASAATLIVVTIIVPVVTNVLRLALGTCQGKQRCGHTIHAQVLTWNKKLFFLVLCSVLLCAAEPTQAGFLDSPANRRELGDNQTMVAAKISNAIRRAEWGLTKPDNYAHPIDLRSLLQADSEDDDSVTSDSAQDDTSPSPNSQSHVSNFVKLGGPTQWVVATMVSVLLIGLLCYCLYWLSENRPGCFTTAKRICIFGIATAGLATCDVLSDYIVTTTFWQDGLMVFCAISALFLVLNPICVWIFLTTQGKAGRRDLYKYILPVAIWEHAYDAIRTGQAGFDLGFIALMEASCEAAPQCLLQWYSLLIKVRDLHGLVLYVIPKKLMAEMSIVIGLVSLGKSFTTFDFYGQKNVSTSQLVLRFMYRCSEVSLRLSTLANFGALLRPEDAGARENVAIHLPIMMSISFLATLVIVKTTSKIDEMSMIVLWSIQSLVCTPPEFLHAFDQCRLPLFLLRILEILIIATLVCAYAPDALERFWDEAVLNHIAIAALPGLVVSVIISQVQGGDPLGVLPWRRRYGGYERAINAMGGEASDALITAVQEDDLVMTRILAKFSDVNGQPADEGPPAITYARSVAVVEVLKNNGLDMDSPSFNDAFFAALENSNLEMTQALATRKTVNSVNKDGRRAITYARSVAVVEMLKNNGLDMDSPSSNDAFFTALESSNLEMTQALATRNAVNSVNKDGRSAITLVNSATFLQVLLDAGLDVASSQSHDVLKNASEMDDFEWFWTLAQAMTTEIVNVDLDPKSAACQQALQKSAEENVGLFWELFKVMNEDMQTVHLAYSGGRDYAVKVWELGSGRCLQTLKGHSGSVLRVAALGTSQCLSSCADNTVKVWDLGSGRCLKTLEGHSWGTVNSVAVLGTSQCLSGGDDGTVKVWDLGSGRCLQTLEGHIKHVNSVAVLGTSQCLSGSDDMTVKVWDLASGRCLQTLVGHSGSVTSVAALGTSQCLSGSEDNTVKVWDLGSGRCLKTLEGHSKKVRSVAVLGTSQCLSGSEDHTVKVWDLGSGRCLQTLEGHGDDVRSVAVLGTSQCLSGGDCSTLKVWDLSSGRCLQTLRGHSDWVLSVAAPRNL